MPFLKPVLFLLLTFLLACGSSDREENLRQQRQMEIQQQMVNLPDGFRSDLETLLDHYFELKDALVASDVDLSTEKAAILADFASNMEPGGLNPETEVIWMAFRDPIITESQALTEETDINRQRIPFEEISESMIDLVDIFNPAGYDMYHQSCPMVRDGSADWLSREEKIENPYHGERMMNCGEVVREL